MMVKTLGELRGNMLQNKAAEMLGISKSYLSLLEKGKRRMSLDIAEKLVQVYGVRVDEVLDAYKVCRKSTLVEKRKAKIRRKS
jgi:transcriptional regulator with XRE-family HTH domain